MLSPGAGSPDLHAFAGGEKHGEGEHPFRGNSPFEGPERERLIENIYSGRRVVVYYELLLLAVFMTVVICHWSSQLKYWLQRYRLRSKSLRISESSVNERSGLLPQAQPRPRKPRRQVRFLVTDTQQGSVTRFYNQVVGFFMTQPQGNGMENFGVMTSIAVYIIVSVSFCCYDVSSHPILIGFRLGHMATVNAPLLYILGAKRSPFSFITGWSYEQINVFHRYVGTLCVCAILGHTAVFVVYFRAGYLVMHLWSIGGIVAGTCFMMIGLTSLPRFRNLFYETFYYVHLVCFLVTLPAIFIHYPTARPFAVLASCSVLYDRTARLLYDYRFVKCRLVQTAGGTVIMEIPLPKHSTWRDRIMLRHPFSWKSGQHLYITVPSCGMFESHPYTIATSMRYSETLNLIIRARNGFSRRLYDYCSSNGGDVDTWCIFHGPYGLEPPEMPVVQHDLLDIRGVHDRSTRIVLVAGGAGVAFTYSLWQEYVLSFRNAGIDGFDVKFVWIIPDSSFTSWIEVDKGMDVWITKEQGRPNVHALVTSYIGNSDNCWVATCGPDPLLREVRNCVAGLRGQGRYGVHYYAERFGW